MAIVAGLALVGMICAVGIGSGKTTPVLRFIGYSGLDSGMNAVQYAQFELRNTTSKTIWLQFGGSEFPLDPPFITQPAPGTPIQTNRSAILVRSLHYFTTGERISPGKALQLEYRREPGRPALKVGLRYYSGEFKDGSDFLNAALDSISPDNPSIKERAGFYLNEFKRRFGRARPLSIWCNQVVTYRTNAHNSSVRPYSAGTPRYEILSVQDGSKLVLREKGRWEE